MARHLKSIVKNRLKCAVAYYAPHSEISASHRRGVCYLVPVVGIDMFWGAMNTHKEGRHYRKHVIVRRVPRRGGQLLQLYTYRFPKSWSAACVANRELIKEAQRRAHALEHDCSYAGIDWHIRFFKHYFRVVKGGAAPEPGMKPYSRFYQYTYVAIYRELKAAQSEQTQVQTTQQQAQATQQQAEPLQHPAQTAQQAHEPAINMNDITFDPIRYLPSRTRRVYPLRRVLAARDYINDPPPKPSPLIPNPYLTSK